MTIDRAQALSVIEAFTSLIRVSRTIIHRDAEHSVSGTPVAILRLVRDTDLRLGDLAERLRVKPSVASRATATLEAEGLVERVTDPDDARACRIHLTESGRTQVRQREDNVVSLVANTFADWSPDEIEQSVRMMRRLEDGVLDWLGEDTPAQSGPPGPTAAGTGASDPSTNSLEETVA